MNINISLLGVFLSVALLFVLLAGALTIIKSYKSSVVSSVQWQRIFSVLIGEFSQLSAFAAGYSIILTTGPIQFILILWTVFGFFGGIFSFYEALFPKVPKTPEVVSQSTPV